MTFFNYMLNITSSTCVSLKQSPIMLKININLMSYFSGGIYMSNNKQPEVIDPEDKRYKDDDYRSEEHTSELQSRFDLVCRLLLEKKKKKNIETIRENTIKYGETI